MEKNNVLKINLLIWCRVRMYFYIDKVNVVRDLSMSEIVN